MLESLFLVGLGAVVGYVVGAWRVGKYKRLADRAAARLHEAIEYDRGRQSPG